MAWLLIQHADDLQLQHQSLALLREAACAGEAENYQVAFLIDRIRVREGKPQVFGTQFTCPPGKPCRPFPVKRRSTLENRRKKMGLEPFSDFLEALRKREHKGRHGAPHHRPA